MYDVIIVGGGAAGLMAAVELSKAGKQIVVLEAAGQLGGRINSVHKPQYDRVVELGAEFIHGDLELTKKLCDAAGIEYKKTGGEFWRKEGRHFIKEQSEVEDESKLDKAFKKLTTDMTIQDFLQKYFADDEAEQQSIKGYIEGYYAGDVSNASTLFFKEEWQKSDEVQYRITGGYGLMIDHLKKEFKNLGGVTELNAVVTEVVHNQNGVDVYAGTKKYLGKKVIVTVSVGVMQQGSIKFTPDLHHINAAFEQLGFGAVIKIVLQFKEPFWISPQGTTEKLDKMAFLFTDEVIPTWWTMYPEKSNQLTGWITGEAAAQKKELTDDDLLSLAFASLCNIYDLTVEELKDNTTGVEVKNWCADTYILGGYSYETVDAKGPREIIMKGINDAVFFAGEGLHAGIDLGTVEAALQTGKDAAQRLLDV